MTKIHEYEQISKETLPKGFRITKEESVYDNGMPDSVLNHYESLADISDEDLDQKAKAGELFCVTA